MWLNLPYSTCQFPSWKSNIGSTNQEITGHLFNLNIQHSDHSNQTVHLQPVESGSHLTPYHISIHFNIILKSTLIFSKWADLFLFSTYNFVCISAHTHVCHIWIPSHPPWFDKLSIPIPGRERKLWIPSLRNYFQPPINFALSSSDILLSTSFSNSLKIVKIGFILYKTTDKHMFVYCKHRILDRTYQTSGVCD